MDIERAARAWLAEDPDPTTRAELQTLLDAGDVDGLRDRFDHQLTFGTAGLRGRLGAGPNRMNRAMVRRVTAGLAARLRQGLPPDRDTTPLVVVGRDARHGSREFAADTVAVLAGAGIRVAAFDDVVPTPLVAYAVRRLQADAGVVITASHNPPADNGYKVYGPGGRQIIPPTDDEIAQAIAAVGPLDQVALADPDDPLITPLGEDLVERYVADVLAMVEPGPRALRIVTTALHGVAGDLCVRLLGDAGFTDVRPVPEQQQPDPDFPTVAFPNPEEPGAMDLALDLARRDQADLVLANDPDGDRIAVAVPDAAGWRLLSGDEVGWLLAEDLLARRALTAGRRPHVGTTVVSSTLLRDIAAHHDAGYFETLTGFKWLAQVAEQLADRGEGTAVLTYEQALGVSVGDLVRDKDGLSAALAVADLAARLRAAGRSLPDLLDDLARRHGAHVTVGRSVALAGADGDDLVQAALDRLRARPPVDLGGSPVVTTWDHDAGVVTGADGSIQAIDLPATPLLRFLAQDQTMVMVRPSGTEPKLKFYGEAVVPVDGDPAAARTAAAARVEAVLETFMAHVLPG